MTRRILPRDEYARLVGTDLGPLADRLPPDTDVIVVEDEAGAIVGCAAIFCRDHVECAWIAEPHRNEPDVFWSLFSGIRKTAECRGSSRLVTASIDDRMAEFLMQMHAEPLPGRHWVWPIARES